MKQQHPTASPTAPTTRRELVAMVWRHAPSKFSGSRLLVLVKLAGLHDGTKAYPSAEWLAKSCGLTRRGVQKVLQSLRKSGVLKIKERGGHSSHYHIVIDKLRELPLVHPGDPSDNAVGIAGALFRAITSEVPAAVVCDDWADVWPVAVQAIMDRGHNQDTILKVARYALNNEPYRSTIIVTGAVALAEVFDNAKLSMDGVKE